mmetsp:Transcript_30589/g.55023  ORF Transcript_30589/g.55023 Transcript_30589/m.55023 type:complete len:501 (+) Transcript_30589:1285-2787(+)
MGPQLPGSSVRHVTGHTHPLLQVLQALTNLLVQHWSRTGGVRALQEGLGHALQGHLYCVDDLWRCWAGVGVGLGSHDRGKARQRGPAGRKHSHICVVVDKALSCLSPGCRLVVAPQPQHEWLDAICIGRRERKVPALAVLSINLADILIVLLVAAPQLWGKVMTVRVEVGLHGAVGCTAVHRVIPLVQVRPAAVAADLEALEVRNGGGDALEERGEHDVNNGEPAAVCACLTALLAGQEVRASTGGQHPLHLVHGSHKHALAPSPCQPLKPGPKHLALQREQGGDTGPCRGVVLWAEGSLGEFGLQRSENFVAVGNALALDLRCWEQLPELGDILSGFVPITAHVDLLHAVADLLLLQGQPHLLAVGAPASMITVQLHLNIFRFVITKEAEKREGIGLSTSLKPRTETALLLRLLPAQGICKLFPRENAGLQCAGICHAAGGPTGDSAAGGALTSAPGDLQDRVHILTSSQLRAVLGPDAVHLIRKGQETGNVEKGVHPP